MIVLHRKLLQCFPAFYYVNQVETSSRFLLCWKALFCLWAKPKDNQQQYALGSPTPTGSSWRASEGSDKVFRLFFSSVKETSNITYQASVGPCTVNLVKCLVSGLHLGESLFLTFLNVFSNRTVIVWFWFGFYGPLESADVLSFVFYVSCVSN